MRHNHFEARLWDSRLGRWLTTDPAGQYASPYLGMGNNPVNGVDKDGRSFTDFINSVTGEHIYINDGINQVVNVAPEDWSLVEIFARLDNINYSRLSSTIYFSLLSRTTIRTDLKYTIPNVLEGKSWIRKGNMECGAAARKQNRVGGAEPAWENDRIDMYIKGGLGNFSSGMNAIDQALEAGYPIMAGVKIKYEYKNVGNANAFTRHFINVVGRSIHPTVPINIYSFIDNAYNGNNLNLNKLYIVGNGLESYYSTNFKVTEVRPNIKTW